MKSNLYGATIVASLFLSACSGSKNADGQVNVIPLGAAIDSPTTLNVSDCFSQVSYIPLETNDSCLVGQGPRVQVIKDKILVSTNQYQCLMFDRTGKFIRQVGHVGNDAEGYSDVHCWYNNETGTIYFPGWGNELVCYDQEGVFKGKIKIPFDAQGTSYSYRTDEILVAYKQELFGAAGSEFHIFKDNEQITSFPIAGTEARPIDPSDIASISILKSEAGVELYGPTAYSGVMLIDYKEPETGSVVLLGNSNLWRHDQDLYFKEAYNDTIYQVKDTALIPSSVLDLGKYHWEFSERFMKNKDNAALVTQVLDSEDRMIIRFIRGLFHKAVLYDAVVNKSTGKVKVGLYTDGMKDDLAGFMPLQPVTISPAGEYAGLLPSAEVVEWFEEHSDSKLPQSIKKLQEVGEEDNPVVVIMK